MGGGSIPIPEIEEAAIKELGLRRVATEELTIARLPQGEGFRFIETRGSRPVNGAHLKRIKSLVIPPAWTDVRVARDKHAHLQAIGRDDAGRLQYIYHSSWDDVRAVSKAHRLLEFGKALPRLRLAIARDIGFDSPAFPLAAAARLVDLTYLRAGHEAYAGDEGGRGAATLLKRHLKVDGCTISLTFRGKGGKTIEKHFEDEILAAALAKLHQWKGARLFKLKVNGGLRPMTATDLNSYLVRRSGRSISTKDFRTFFASACALERLREGGAATSPTAGRKIIRSIAKEISRELANTPAITRKSYIHPAIVEAFQGGQLATPRRRRCRRGLNNAETELIRFIDGYLSVNAG
jgi:DNA topoisomerase-1